MSNKEFYDLCYDVWMSGKNPDLVDRDRFDRDYDNHYDSLQDESILRREVSLQRGKDKKE